MAELRGEKLRLEEAGSKTCLRNQRKYVQSFQKSQGVEDVGRQLCQGVNSEISESNKK